MIALGELRVPAIRNGDKFINLYANYEFELANGKLSYEDMELFNTSDTIRVRFINKRPFVL